MDDILKNYLNKKHEHKSGKNIIQPTPRIDVKNKDMMQLLK